MALDTLTILSQIDAVLTRAGVNAENPFPVSQRAGARSMPPSVEVRGYASAMASSCLALIERIAPNSSYAKTARAMAGDGRVTSATVERLIGVVVSLRQDVEAGYTQTLVELVHADVFADYLAMAAELQKGGFKDAAAVIAGSTLEEHLRKLATKANVSITDARGASAKVSRINDDLKDTAYNALDHRQVQAWLDIRNSAAHGVYGDYDHKQVANMLAGIGDFMVRNPA